MRIISLLKTMAFFFLYFLCCCFAGGISVAVAEPEPVPSAEPTVLTSSVYSAPKHQAEQADSVINVLLLGMDTRSDNLNSSSDTMIMFSYNYDKHAVRMLSFMRDTWVEIPGHYWSRLNAATAEEGPELLLKTIEHNFGISCDNYAQITFKDFRKIVDILGGVDLELTRAEIDYINKKLHVDDNDWNNDITAEPGVIHLNGAQSLWQCRDRSVGDADFERTGRQREFLQALATQTMSGMDVFKFIQLVPSILTYVRTNMETEELLALAKNIYSKGMPTIEDSRLPYDGLFEFTSKSGQSVLVLEMEENIELATQFLQEGWTHEAEVLKDGILPASVIYDMQLNGHTEPPFARPAVDVSEDTETEPVVIEFAAVTGAIGTGSGLVSGLADSEGDIGASSEEGFAIAFAPTVGHVSSAGTIGQASEAESFGGGLGVGSYIAPADPSAFGENYKSPFPSSVGGISVSFGAEFIEPPAGHFDTTQPEPSGGSNPFPSSIGGISIKLG